MEETIGHVTFARNLRRAVENDPSIEAAWFPILFPPSGFVESLPIIRSNWSVRASLRAKRRLGGAARSLDGLLIHTQTSALLAAGTMRRIPTLVSIDATPSNYDEIGSGYGHRVGHPRVEALKKTVVARPLRRAAGVVAWSEWVARSLRDTYGVPSDRVHVVPAGTVLPPAPTVDSHAGPPRVLFVGGDFLRKGGLTLLNAVARIESDVVLDIVTKSEPVETSSRTSWHRDINPGDEKLSELYSQADIFVLPTSADASPHVILEAMAAGLAIIATPVGAVPEMIEDGISGVLVPAGDVQSLAAAMVRLMDTDFRSSLGREARRRCEDRYDADANCTRVLELMKTAAEGAVRGTEA
jgi:glycosyltransferase involved in cell wall biosynthesis